MPRRVTPDGNGQIRSPGLLDVDVAVDGRVGDSPAPQVEEPVAFHRQLEPALQLNGGPCKLLVSPRCGVPSDSVQGPGSPQGVEIGLMNHRYGHAGQTGIGRARRVLGLYQGIGGGSTPLRHLPGSCADLIDDRPRVLEVTSLHLRLGQLQQQIGVPEDVQVHRIQLLRLPAHFALRTTGLFVDVLFRAVRTRVQGVADPSRPRLVEPPVLVGHVVPADRPVQPRVHGNGGVGHEIAVVGVPVGIRQRGG